MNPHVYPHFSFNGIMAPGAVVNRLLPTLLSIVFVFFAFQTSTVKAQARADINCSPDLNPERLEISCRMSVSGAGQTVQQVRWTQIFNRVNKLRSPGSTVTQTIARSSGDCFWEGVVMAQALDSGMNVIASAAVYYNFGKRGCRSGSSDRVPQFPSVPAESLRRGVTLSGSSNGGNTPAPASVVGHEAKRFGANAWSRRVGAAGVGVRSIVEAGFIDAFDVWGEEVQGEICFGGTGRLIFLDAATSPRSQGELQTYRQDDRTCARIDRPGTVVLMPAASGRSTTAPESGAASTGVPALPQTPGSPGASGRTTTPSTVATAIAGQAVPLNEESLDLMVPLENCRIRTVFRMKLRASPGGNVIGAVPAGTTIAVDARTPNWFRGAHLGLTGWINEYYVSEYGACG